MNNLRRYSDSFLPELRRCYHAALEVGPLHNEDEAYPDRLAAHVGSVLAGLRMAVDNVPDSPWTPAIRAYFECFDSDRELIVVPHPTEAGEKVDGAGAILVSLRGVEECLSCVKNGDREFAWAAACLASFWNGVVGRSFITDFYPSDEHARLARSGAAARLKNSPKQKAKELIEEEFRGWQKGLARYKSDADFARKMLQKFPVIETPRTVTGWASKWRKCSIGS